LVKRLELPQVEQFPTLGGFEGEANVLGRRESSA
jgi:hypothetical protein